MGGLSKKKRFEVLKRDSFTCQYCGDKAPDVVLQVDHIVPSSKGGTNDLLNLVASCQPCNAGKSDRELSDASVINTQRDQLDDMQARREQLAQLFEWQRSMADLSGMEIDGLCGHWEALAPGFVLADPGRAKLRKWRAKFDLVELMEAMRKSAAQHFCDGATSEDSDTWIKAFNYIPKIAGMARLDKDKPHMRGLMYARGILRNRLSYMKDRECLGMLESAYCAGVSVDTLQAYAKTAGTWSEWVDGMDTMVEGAVD